MSALSSMDLPAKPIELGNRFCDAFVIGADHGTRILGIELHWEPSCRITSLVARTVDAVAATEALSSSWIARSIFAK